MIMAFWGAPLNDAEHAIHGVESALAMQKRIRGLDDEFVKRGWPILHVGVGLNCGEMNVGDMGSRFRRAYTVMGDAVNIGSRLEALTKEYGVGILVSQSQVKAAQGFVYREIDKAAVKGRQEGIGIFEPIGKVGEVGETQLQEIDRFHKALELYRKQRWDDAQETLKNSAYARPTASSTSCTSSASSISAPTRGSRVERPVGLHDQIVHPLEERIPGPGEAIAVADGVWWIRMPLPFALDHINLWLLEDGDAGRSSTRASACRRRGTCGSNISPA